MNNLNLALRVEIIKIKRTLSLWVTVLAPLFIVALSFFFNFRLSSAVSGADKNAWLVLFRDTQGFWTVLMLPFFVVLLSALLAHLDHDNKMWKYLYSQPVSRSSYYLAKLFITILFVSFAFLILLLGIFGGGTLAQISNIRPDFRWMMDSILVFKMISTTFISVIMSLFMVAIQTYISLRWQNFTITLGVGILATIISFVGISSGSLSHIFPWSLPFNAFGYFFQGTYPHLQADPTISVVTVSIVGAVLVTIFGVWDTTRRDVE